MDKIQLPAEVLAIKYWREHYSAPFPYTFFEWMNTEYATQAEREMSALREVASKGLMAMCDRYEALLNVVHQKAKEGIFPHLPVETMGAQKCIEIDKLLTEALSAGEGKKEGENG